MKELDLLKQFLNDTSEKSIDFYPLDKNIHHAELTIFGRTQAGCLVGFWKNPADADTEDGKIIWLDSEGEPNAVFAANFHEFVGLLYFDTGFIYNVLTRILRNPAAAPLSTDEIKNYAESAANTYPNYANLKKFIMEELSIPVPIHPDVVIKNAYPGSNIPFPYTVDDFR